MILTAVYQMLSTGKAWNPTDLFKVDMPEPSIQTLLQNFFLQRLMQKRKIFAETTRNYRDIFRIYLQYIQDVNHKSSPEIEPL